MDEQSNRGWDIIQFDWIKHPPELFSGAVYAVVTLFVVAVLLIGLPAFFQFGFDALIGTPSDRIEAAKVYFPVLVALIGGPVIIWRALTAHWQARAARQEADISREGLYTSLFTKAVEQLGATRESIEVLTAEDEFGSEITRETITRTVPSIEVRLGAIYALERIAHDSERDHWPIMEVLCAYVRENSKTPSIFRGQEITTEDENDEDVIAEKVSAIRSWAKKQTGLRLDVQAAITVIGRRSRERREMENKKSASPDFPGEYRLDFREAGLQGADLRSLHFERALFDGAFLDGALLQQTKLQNARLRRTKLRGANLKSAECDSATFDFADLTGADASLVGASRTRFFRARLYESNLENSNMHRANLMFARLVATNLRNSDLSWANFYETNLTRTDLIKAKIHRCGFWRSVLTEAKFYNSTIYGSSFEKATGLTIEQVNSVYEGDETTSLPDGLDRPEEWPKKPLNETEITERIALRDKPDDDMDDEIPF